jgi:hypothetical protein
MKYLLLQPYATPTRRFAAGDQVEKRDLAGGAEIATLVELKILAPVQQGRAAKEVAPTPTAES